MDRIARCNRFRAPTGLRCLGGTPLRSLDSSRPHRFEIPLAGCGLHSIQLQQPAEKPWLRMANDFAQI